MQCPIAGPPESVTNFAEMCQKFMAALAKTAYVQVHSGPDCIRTDCIRHKNLELRMQPPNPWSIPFCYTFVVSKASSGIEICIYICLSNRYPSWADSEACKNS